MNRYYKQGWIAAAAVVFAFFALIALTRCGEPVFQPPAPPTARTFPLLPFGAVSTLQPNWQGPIQEPVFQHSDPTNLLHTATFEVMTNSTERYFLWRAEAVPVDGRATVLQVTTNGTDWIPLNEPGTSSGEIVGYMVRSNMPPKVLFRGVPQ